MRKTIVIFIKGLIIGLAKIIPGVSGAVIAISLGVYEKGLQSLSKFTKESVKFLLNIGSGILISMILFSKMVIYLLDNYSLPTVLLFIGLIIGGSTEIKKEVNISNKKNFIIFIISLIFLLVLSKLAGNNVIVLHKNIHSYFSIIIAGIIDAFATVVPGISGTALLMIYGYYNIIMKSISTIFIFKNISTNLFILSAYSLGMLVGIITFSKIITYFFNKHRSETYSVIFGFIISTIILLFISSFSINATVIEIIFSLFLLNIGYFLAKKLTK